MVEFKNENGTICSKTEKYYNSIKKYAKRYKLKNTKIALDLALCYIRINLEMVVLHTLSTH